MPKNSLNRALEKNIRKNARLGSESKPVIFDAAKKGDKNSLSSLFSRGEIKRVVDDYAEQQRELFAVKNPSLVYAPGFKEKFETYYKSLEKNAPILFHGRWAYFPWLFTVVHILEDNDFQLVRTARNRNLISAEEQKRFYNSTIGIGGLSVGNSVALAIVLQGGGRHIRLADHDAFALSNMNRVRAGVENLGLPKVLMTARQIYEINPYSKVEIFPEGLTRESIKKFFAGPPKLDIVIDELDNLAVKFLIREQAKRYKLAVVMAADNGDNAVVDVERYDTHPKTPFFHGRMGRVSYEMLSSLDKFGIGKMITKHVGPENVTERMKASLLEMGKTIVSWPQLGGAALINGAAVAYCVRKILNGQPLEQNRALISLDEKLVPNYNSHGEKKKRAKSIRDFKKIFGL